MSRPQVGIDRLPSARRAGSEQRESMNCKSCRKRKIKCNRLRPACEACQVFACPCIYDAVPKKRGPKTDVLEALLKRVDGLEKRLHSEGKEIPTHTELGLENGRQQEKTDLNSSDGSAASQRPPAQRTQQPPRQPPHPPHPPPQRPFVEITPGPASLAAASLITPTEPTPVIVPDVLLDTYFARIHGKPYYVLDEVATRARMQTNTLPPFLAYAIYAVSVRYVPHVGGYNAAMRMSQEYARRSRMELDVDEPSVEGLQTLLLLAQAAYAAGQGKKSYMLLTSGVSMALALDLHRELPLTLKVNPPEREARRRLFWACYLMDRFSACGSRRPSLISDESIQLRLPSWTLHPGGMLIEGDYFPNGSNLQYMSGPGKLSQGSTGMLIGIVRILGMTNRYLAAGGVKGDSHFPWHTLSNLSKIRQDLDMWASETQDTFTSIESLFGQPDSTLLVLSKLIYHLIHCLIYRPFLPVDLAELSGGSQHQSWQIEATNLCFLHANAIAELVEIGRASSIIDWPEFVGYCICTAGTIHVHGAHYRGRDGEVFSASGEFLSREMHQLSQLRFVWAGIQHQRETLQTIYGCHSELVKSLSSNPMRFSPVFQLEDFFDRYPGQAFDGSHVTFTDMVVDGVHESLTTFNLEHRNSIFAIPPTQHLLLSQQHSYPPSYNIAAPVTQPENRRKRRSTATSSQRPKLTHPSKSCSNVTNLSAHAQPPVTAPPPGSIAEPHPLTPTTASNHPQLSTRKHASPNGNHHEPHAGADFHLSPFSPTPTHIAPFSPHFHFGGPLSNTFDHGGPSSDHMQDLSNPSPTQTGNEPQHAYDAGAHNPIFSLPTPTSYPDQQQQQQHNHADGSNNNHSNNLPTTTTGGSWDPSHQNPAITSNAAATPGSTSITSGTGTNTNTATGSASGSVGTADPTADANGADADADANADGDGDADADADPFLSLLEQLAENDHRGAGPSELDFYLGGSG